MGARYHFSNIFQGISPLFGGGLLYGAATMDLLEETSLGLFSVHMNSIYKDESSNLGFYLEGGYQCIFLKRFFIQGNLLYQSLLFHFDNRYFKSDNGLSGFSVSGKIGVYFY